LFSRDLAPKTVSFEKQDDDGVKTLHEARFLRLPLSNLPDWWKNVPITRPHLYKNVPLKFMGAHNMIADKTIGNLHDNAKPQTLSFHRTYVLQQNQSEGSKEKVRMG